MDILKSVAQDDPLLDCLVILSRLHQCPQSASALKAGLPLVNHKFTPELFVRAAQKAGLTARIVKRSLHEITSLLLPVVLLLKQGQACIYTKRNNGEIELLTSESSGVTRVKLEEMEALYSGFVILVQPVYQLDKRSNTEQLTIPRSWFWSTLLKQSREYIDVLIASLLINLLALASPLFVMNVYDRVVPNNAMETLWVLTIGVITVFIFEFLFRMLRGYLLDLAGKKVDVLLSSMLFQQVMGMRMEKRPASAGALANNMREFETVRDFFTSITFTTLVDVPFLVLFILVIAFIAGHLAWIVVLAVPLVITMDFFIQRLLARVINENLAQSSQKHGILVESIANLEAIKVLSAEGLMQGKWERLVGLTAKTAMKSRTLSSLAVYLALGIQQLIAVVVVVVGVYQISQGELTMGALIACTILTGRALAPLSQVSNLLVRYQNARMALQMLDQLMKTEQERPQQKKFIHRPKFKGEILFDQVNFRYPGQKTNALNAINFHIKPGECVAILGKVGSGKSTLQKLMAGLYRPTEGTIRFDGIDIEQIDPMDLRHNVGYVSQEPRLFYGTLRENIVMGMPTAHDEAILAISQLAGVDDFVDRHPAGFDMPVGEGGEGLSGGQRQAVAIARALLANPAIILLDEPTGSMDSNSEQNFIQQMQDYLQGKTLLIVTHKLAMLALVNRIIVIDNGKIAADGPKDDIMRFLYRS